MSQISSHPASIQPHALDHDDEDKKTVDHVDESGVIAIDDDKEADQYMQDVEEEWLNDREHPRNWPSGKKWIMISIVSSRVYGLLPLSDAGTHVVQVGFYTFATPLASSMMASALPDIKTHFNIASETILAMTLSIFLISFATGPLLLAPLSEMYGRTWVSALLTAHSTLPNILPQVLHINMFLFAGFNLGCAFSPTVGSLIAFRFLGTRPPRRRQCILMLIACSRFYRCLSACMRRWSRRRPLLRE